MNAAANHAIILNGARSGGEFARAIERAKSDAIAEEYNEKDGELSALEFPDASRLEISLTERAAKATPEEQDE